MEMTSQNIVQMAHYLSKVHHVPGRLRVRVDKKIVDKFGADEAQNLDAYIKNLQGINDVRFNKTVGSVTILYDKERIKMDFWEDLLCGDVRAQAQVEQILRANHERA